MSDNDSEITLAMRRILAYAKEQLPESTVLILSFTPVEYQGETLYSNKIATNSEDREWVVGIAAQTLDGFLSAPISDLRGVTIQ